MKTVTTAILTIVFFGLASVSLHAENWIVPDEVDDIQTALNASQPGDTVLVREGIYNEQINFNGRDIVLGSWFLVDPNPDYITNTIIDPEGAEGSIITFAANETPAAQLTGFTITGGSALSGGGIIITNASPTISDIVISQCQARFNGGGGMGGGIYAQGSPAITRVVIDSCTAAYGAGLVIRDGRTTVSELVVTGCEGTGVDRSPSRSGGVMVLTGTYTFENCTFSGNISHGGGAGFYSASSTVTFLNCTVQNNRAVDASGTGGGLSFQNNSVIRMERCLVTGNSATVNGGGITMYTARADIVNCTITENSAGTAGGAIYQFTDCRVVSVNSIIAHNGDEGAITFSGGNTNSFTSAYSCIPGGADGIAVNGAGSVNWLDGNIEDDPLLAGAHDGDFHLIPESPCIDTGTNDYQYEGRVLVSLGDDQFEGEMPDIGVYEFIPDKVEIEPTTPAEHPLISAYPNPFNSATSVSYVVPQSGEYDIILIDSKGRSVARLAGGWHESGIYRRNLNGEAMPSGLYFISLLSNSSRKVIPVVLQK